MGLNRSTLYKHAYRVQKYLRKRPTIDDQRCGTARADGKKCGRSVQEGTCSFDASQNCLCMQDMNDSSLKFITTNAALRTRRPVPHVVRQRAFMYRYMRHGDERPAGAVTTSYPALVRLSTRLAANPRDMATRTTSMPVGNGQRARALVPPQYKRM